MNDPIARLGHWNLSEKIRHEYASRGKRQEALTSAGRRIDSKFLFDDPRMYCIVLT